MLEAERLAQVRQLRHESYTELGRTLAHVIDPGRRFYTRQYMHALTHGQFPFTPTLIRGLTILEAMADGAGELAAKAQEVTVPIRSTHELPEGTVILGKARGCDLAGCRVMFVAASNRQLYCSQECKREARRRREHANL